MVEPPLLRQRRKGVGPLPCESGHERGPLLLGVVGNLDWRGKYIRINQHPSTPESWLLPVGGKACHYTIKDKPGYEAMPHYEIQDQVFTSYPVFPARTGT